MTSSSQAPVGALFPGRAAVALPRLDAAVRWNELPFRTLIMADGHQRQLRPGRWSLTDRWQAWHVTMERLGNSPGCRRGGALGLWHCGSVIVGPALVRVANTLHWAVQVSGMPSQGQLIIGTSRPVAGPLRLRPLALAGPGPLQIELRRGTQTVRIRCSTASGCALVLVAGSGPVQLQMQTETSALPPIALRLERMQP